MMNLTQMEYETVEAIAITLLPSDDTPGAADTPVVAMVLGIVKGTPPEQFELFRSALAFVNVLARNMHGDDLARLPPPQREEVVKAIPTVPELALFWQTLRTLIMLNFYSIPKVFRSIGLPGPNIDQGGLPVRNV
ncbi:gluconate 2-dehydrogenase subunit 3 family protein [Vitiosangium sp. GDMCC 1.1324]|uniref:gluconate 2-dehydrogenase subunit 3 family protein n=1 Tax=Vitiosangium sp. (strain GDMCC 1.1324) TaxID=2138576 RepID=UPI000D35F0A5|nr:gluconate 2-dehydrogenase subunit 3 family protein [Vitiosangium sp. GDMCC 1.1324]PTL82103.1 hypothetical protein DAT35_20085 [Vitiosangium sp. GDMCC 1.1324]